MSPPLLRACSLGDSEHTDLPLPAPSSSLRRQSPQCARSTCSGGNCGRRSRSLPDLAGHLTARADGGHALPLGSSGKVFNLSFILPSLLVRFSALSWIKPHAAPLVVLPRQFLKVSVLRPYFPGGELSIFISTPPILVGWATPCSQRLRPGLLGYLIRFAPLAFVPHRQIRSSQMPSPLVVYRGLYHFTSPHGIPLTPPGLETASLPCTPSR